MFPQKFEERLVLWHQLRESTATDRDFLTAVNTFWMMAPTIDRWLHWQDQNSWPDPWVLLNNHAYCDVAKALGIVYTIMLSGRLHLLENTQIEQIADVLEQANVVIINDGKYVLNWDLHNITNISLVDFSAKFIISTDDLKAKIK